MKSIRTKLLLLLLLAGFIQLVLRLPSITAQTNVEVSVRALSGKKITFSDLAFGEREIPHLILFKNGVLTNEISRTAVITLDNLNLLPEGQTVTLILETQTQRQEVSA